MLTETAAGAWLLQGSDVSSMPRSARSTAESVEEVVAADGRTTIKYCSAMAKVLEAKQLRQEKQNRWVVSVAPPARWRGSATAGMGCHCRQGLRYQACMHVRGIMTTDATDAVHKEHCRSAAGVLTSSHVDTDKAPPCCACLRVSPDYSDEEQAAADSACTLRVVRGPQPTYYKRPAALRKKPRPATVAARLAGTPASPAAKGAAAAASAAPGATASARSSTSSRPGAPSSKAAAAPAAYGAASKRTAPTQLARTQVSVDVITDQLASTKLASQRRVSGTGQPAGPDASTSASTAIPPGASRFTSRYSSSSDAEQQEGGLGAADILGTGTHRQPSPAAGVAAGGSALSSWRSSQPGDVQSAQQQAAQLGLPPRPRQHRSSRGSDATADGSEAEEAAAEQAAAAGQLPAMPVASGAGWAGAGRAMAAGYLPGWQDQRERLQEPQVTVAPEAAALAALGLGKPVMSPGKASAAAAVAAASTSLDVNALAHSTVVMLVNLSRESLPTSPVASPRQNNRYNSPRAAQLQVS